MIAIINYSAGNLRSVKRALDFLGIMNEITNSPKKVEEADAVIVPGVGAAGTAMRSLEEAGLAETIRKSIAAGKPFLGICLGLQILFEKSAEDDSKCLGVLEGEVVKFSAPEIKVPHIGWNPVEFSETPQILVGIESDTPFYFAHSYFGVPQDENLVKATTTHGEIFPAVVNRGNVWGVQFHPEKSGRVGLQVLENFAKMI
ncbi:MAG: imidazole glycerol phosphate synthase subunit HisH [Patescibacteria group bacterium]